MIYDGNKLGVAGNSCQLPSVFLKAKLGKPPGSRWPRGGLTLGKANLFSTAFFISSYSKSQAHTTAHMGWVNVGLNPVWGFLSPLEAGRLLLKIQMLTAVSNCKRSKTPSWQSEEVPGPTDPLRTDKYFNKKSTWGDWLWDWMWLFPTFRDLVVLLLLHLTALLWLVPFLTLFASS